MRTSSSIPSSLFLASLLAAGPTLAGAQTSEPGAAATAPVGAAPAVTAPAVTAGPAASAAPAATPAESPARVQRQISDRQLSGHTFQPSHLMLDPFLVTSVGAHTAGLAGQALGPALDWSTWPPTVLQDTKWYNYTGFAQQFDVDVRFLEHFSARINAGAGMYTGAGGGRGSSLVVGTSVKGAFEFELKGSWAPTSSVRVAGTIGATSNPAVSILVLQGVIDSIKAGQFEPSMLAQGTTTTTWRGGATAAWAPARFLGLQAQAELLYAVTSGAFSVEQGGVKLAAMADLDLLPFISWLPIGVNTTINVIAPTGAQGMDRSSNFGLGIWYTGRKDVALGLESIWQEGRLDNELKTKNSTTWINLRYYW